MLGATDVVVGGVSTIKMVPPKRPHAPPSVRHKSNEPNAPPWPEDNYDIAKRTLYRYANRDNISPHFTHVSLIEQGDRYYHVEIHVAQGSAAKERKYRIFVHHGSLKELTASSGSAGTYECRYLDNLADVEALCSSIFNHMAGHSYYRVNLLAGSKIGSDRALATSYNRFRQRLRKLPPDWRRS